MSSTPPPSGVRIDPLTSILGSAEWLSRPRGRAGGASSPGGGGGETTGLIASSSPRERERDGNRSGQHHGQPAGDGNVWHGVLRLSEGPWQKRGLREEDLREGNTSSRETSLSDDGSGASDSIDNPEVTMDENTTSQQQQQHRPHKKNRARGVNFSHEDSNAGLLLGGGGGGGGGGADAEGAAGGDGNSSIGEEDEEGSGATGSGDAGGAANDPTAMEAETAVGHIGDGAGGSPPVARTGAILQRQNSVSRGGRRGGSRRGSHSGADVMGRAAGRAMAARGSASEALMCSLIARPPPNDAGIPGTAGGEGQARAAAAGECV